MSPAHEASGANTRGGERLRQVALLWAGAARVALWVLPWPWVCALANRAARPVRRRHAPPLSPAAVGQAVGAASRGVPRCTCLVQALAAHILLRRAGVDSRIDLGVDPTRAATFQAHAWVVSGGKVVVGGDVTRHVPLGSFVTGGLHRNRYRVYGVVLETTLAFPDVPFSGPEGDVWSLRVDPPAALPAPADEEEAFHDRPGAKPWMRLRRRGTKLVLVFPDLAVAEIDAHVQRITCRAAPDVPEATLRHLVLDQIVPRALSLRGAWVVHASAVLTPHGVVGFLANSGSGKSTLAASLTYRGMPLLADDALRLEAAGDKVMAYPAYPALRLWPSSASVFARASERSQPVAHYSSKVRVSVGDKAAAQPAPLVRIYLLEPPASDPAQSEILVHQVARADACMALLRQTFRIETRRPDALQAEFERLTTSPVLDCVRRLCYPKSFDRLSEVRRAILDDLATPAPQ